MAEGGLRKWVKEKWVDIGAPKKNGKYQPCGRSKGSKRKYPKCVPLAKATRMTKGQKASAVRRKRAAGNPGGVLASYDNVVCADCDFAETTAVERRAAA
jgi:hypothetical protein